MLRKFLNLDSYCLRFFLMKNSDSLFILLYEGFWIDILNYLMVIYD